MMWVLLAAMACSGEETGHDSDSGCPLLLRAYEDADGDGWGDLDSATDVCELGEGQVLRAGDCDDADPDLTPETQWFIDGDGDGFGDDSRQVASCTAQDGLVDVAGDCDDGDAWTHPEGEELCDGIDNDCDGEVDLNAADALSLFTDADGDGYGDSPVSACEATTGVVALDGDCDDTDAAISPGAPEICDEIDNDCDGAVDFDGWIPADFATVQDAVDATLEEGHFCLSDGTHVASAVESWEGVTLEGSGSDAVVLDAQGDRLWAAYGDLRLIGVRVQGVVGSGVSLSTGNLSLSGVVFEEVQLQGAYSSLLYSEGGGDFSLQDVEIREVDVGVGHAAMLSLVGASLEMTRVSIHDVRVTGTAEPVVQFSGYSAALDDVEIRSVETEVVSSSRLAYGPLWLGATGSVTVQRLTLQDNHTDFGEQTVDGSGLLLGRIGSVESPAQLSNVRVLNNRVSGGDGASRMDGVVLRSPESAAVRNLIVAGNTVSGEWSILRGVFAGVTLLEHADLVGNDFGTYTTCLGMFYNLSDDLAVLNTNLVGNDWDCSARAELILPDYPALSWTHSNVYGNAFPDTQLYNSADWDTATVSTMAFDPLYVDTSGASAADWDLQLQSGSPAIDAGDGVDVDGSAADIGAYGGLLGASW